MLYISTSVYSNKSEATELQRNEEKVGRSETLIAIGNLNVRVARNAEVWGSVAMGRKPE